MSEDKRVPDIAAGMSAAAAAEPGPAVPATAGEILRAAREAQGLHLAVLAASLKVAPRKLELIESNRHEELADATFARALALSMCRALKIDAEPVLARLPQPAGQRLEQISSGLNQPFRDRPGRSDGAEWELPSLPVIAALLLALAALAVYLLPAGGWSPASLLPSWPQNASAPAASEPQSAAPQPLAPPLAAVAEAPAASAAEAAASAASAAPAAASALVETVFSAPTESAASAPVAGGVLRLRASAESWVEVRDAGGRTLLSRNLAPGEVAGIDGALPLRLTIGNAEATEVLFRGEPVVLKPTRDNVAKLELQ